MPQILPWKELLLRTSSWTFFGYSCSQAVRIIAHLILARLLTPADFGIMQIVNVFVQGMLMVSDLGIGPNIIQHHKGESPLFLRTAWTLQILRGGLLWVTVLLLAFPIALLYDAPVIVWLLPFASISLIFEGFISPQIYVLNRQFAASKLVSYELTSQLLGSISMVTVAWYWRSVWVLAIAPLVTSFLKMTLSHLWLGGPKMGFRWNKPIVREITHFGRWILVSSLAGFLVSRLDRLILGLYLSKTELGIYGIAVSLILLLSDTVSILSNRVLLPLYSHLKASATDSLGKTLSQVRSRLLLGILPPTIGMALFGQLIINALYPETYHAAGWMVQVLAAGATFKFISITLNPVLLAHGDSRRFMFIQLCQIASLLFFMLLLGDLYGSIGLIIAVSITEGINYPIIASQIRRYHVWTPLADGAAMLISGVCILSGWYFLQLWPTFH